jgi:hypothetical protein
MAGPPGSTRVRMGVHTGEASRMAAGLVGLDVHRTARVAAAGHGGQVLVSEASAALADKALPPDAVLTDLGVHRLKDLEAPVRIFQLSEAGLPAEFPPLRTVPGGAVAATRALRRDLASAARSHAGQQPIAWALRTPLTGAYARRKPINQLPGHLRGIGRALAL